MDQTLDQQRYAENARWLKQRQEKISQYAQVTRQILKAVDKVAQEYKTLGLTSVPQSATLLHMSWHNHTYQIRSIITLNPTKFSAHPETSATIDVTELVDGEVSGDLIMTTPFDYLGNIMCCTPDEVGHTYLSALLLALNDKQIKILLP